MPPYQEEIMCNKAMQRKMDEMTAPLATMEDIDIGMGNPQPNNSLGRRALRSSPRRRGHQNHSSNSSRSARSKNGRRVTNINRINVINNYPSPKEHFGWCVLRLVLALLILVWIAAMASIMKSFPQPATSPGIALQSKAAMSLSRWKEISDNTNGGGVRGADTPNDAPNLRPETASIFELSLFGNKSPSDFQLYTPHAPSCTKKLDADSVTYTLVSQLSNDRLWMVQYHCKRWGDNPISIVVFSDRTAEDVKSELVSDGCSEEQLTVQTVSKSKYDPTGKEYPVNLLRNLAFSAVKTTHVVYADVDFWPASDLYTILSGEEIKEQLASDSKFAIVIPVFQMFRRCSEYKDCKGKNIPSMPKNKEGLLNLIRKKKASTFDPTNVGGHGSTKYITWRDQEKGTFVDLPCIKSNRYEPYLVLRYCDQLPPFQEGFTGYGKNKMTWVMQLRRSGYLFSQLGGAFHVHYPHLDSSSRLEWNKKPKAMEKYGKSVSELLEKEEKGEGEDIDWGSFKRARVDALFLDFKEWLDGTVEDEARVHMCEDALNDDVRLWVHSDKGATDDDDAAEEDAGDDEEGEEENSEDPEEKGSEEQEEYREANGDAEDAEDGADEQEADGGENAEKDSVAGENIDVGEAEKSTE